MSKTLSFEYVLGVYEQNGYKVLSEKHEYTSARKSKFLVKCNNGHQYRSTVRCFLLSSKKCYQCFKSNSKKDYSLVSHFKCSSCKKLLQRKNFLQDKSRYNGVSSYCKGCTNVAHRKRRERIKLDPVLSELHKSKQRYRLKKYREKDSTKTKQKEYSLKYKENLTVNQILLRKEKKRLYDKEYSAKNKTKIVKRVSRYKENLCVNNPQQYLIRQIRTNLRESLKYRKYSKKSRSFQILGADWDTVYNYLTKNDQIDIKKMTIDHICPLSQAKNEGEILKLCHFSNLQLISISDNAFKGSKKTEVGVTKCRELLGRDWVD
jgi:hypothetical protein